MKLHMCQHFLSCYYKARPLSSAVEIKREPREKCRLAIARDNAALNHRCFDSVLNKAKQVFDWSLFSVVILNNN